MKIKHFWSSGECIPPLVCSISEGATDAGGASPGGSTSTSSPSSGDSGGSSTSTPAAGQSDTSSGTPPASVTGTQTPPTSAPSPSSSTSAASPPASSGFDFSSIFGELDGSAPAPATVPPTVPATAAPAAPATPATPAQPAPPVAQQPNATAAQPTQQTTAPAQSDTAGQPPAPRFDPTDPLSVASGLGQMRNEAIAHIAKTMFPLTEKDIEGLETNAGEVIPQLLARVFVAAQETYLQQLSRMIPAAFQRLNEKQTAFKKNEEAFFKAWPQLNVQTHGELIQRVGKVWRQQNPTATLEQAVKEIGPMVAFMAGVPLTASTQQPASPNNGVRHAPQPAFQPATSGVASMTDGKGDQGTPFDFLGAQG